MLQILGIIFLLIIGKFIYDTFLTNNTAETKEWYKKNYPEENYRLDRNEGLDFNVKPKTNINDRQRSIYEIAKNMNTTPELVKNTYIEQLKSKINSHDEKIYFLKTIREKKIEEAKTKGIDPDDGVAALMEEWAKEYLNSVDFKTNDKSNLEVSNRYNLEEIENLDNMQNVKLLNGELVTGIIYSQFGDLGEFYQGKARGMQRNWWKNGKLKKEEDFGLDGQCFTSKGWHENGNLYLETIGELKAGEFTIKIYHENGNLQMTKSYKNKYEHGISKTYNQEGGIISEIMFQDGLLHGRNTSYYNNGTKKSITHYNEDIAEGEYKFWYENGNLQREGMLKGSCPIGEWKYYNENGTPKDTKFTSEIENAMQSAIKMPSERKLRKEADDLWNSK
jgi:antitoxin component YwqK of YwqJK toxin-antitoxin module